MYMGVFLSKLVSALSFSSEVWMSLLLGAAVTVLIAYIIYRVQKKESTLHKQDHDAKLERIEQLHLQDSEKIKVLYELIIQSQRGSIGEVEAAVLEQKIEIAADNITNQDSDHAQALKAIADKEKDKADDLLDKIAEQEHNLVNMYNLRAMNEYRNGDYGKAIDWYKKILELEPDNYEAYVNLIKSLDGADRMPEARELATQKLNSLNQESDAPNLKKYDMLRAIVSAYNCEFETDEMEPWIYKLLEMTRQLFAEKSPEMINALNVLGGLYMNRQKYKDSEETYLKVLKIGESGNALIKYELNHTLNNLALLYIHLFRYEEAILLLDKNIRFVNGTLGEGHPESFYPMINQASAYARLDRKLEAENQYLKVRDMVVNKVGKDHDAYFKVMQHLGGMYYESKRYDDSESVTRENLEIQIARKGDRSFEVAVLLRGLAQILVAQDKTEEAEMLIRKSIDIFSIVASPESVQALSARIIQVKIYLKKDNYEEARQELLQMIDILHNQGNYTSGYLPMFYNYLLITYARQKLWVEAAEFLESIIPVFAEDASEEQNYIHFLEKYAEVLANLGRHTEAEECKAKAEELKSKQGQK
jgi:tetratricopeptide (TPR) repeat protein